MSTERPFPEHLTRELAARAEAWRLEQPWTGWAQMPPGPEREQRRAAFLEAWERFQSRCDAAVRPVLEAEHAKRAAAIAEAQMRRYGIPERVWDAVTAPQDTQACRKIAAWLDGGGWFGVLSGGTGVGKTTAACLALRAEGGYFVSATETADHLFDRPWWDGLDAQALVVVDDLGTEKQDGEGYWLARWRDFVNRRYMARRKLLVTCNMPFLLVKQRYVDGDGERTAERISDGGTYMPVEGESMRFAGGGA